MLHKLNEYLPLLKLYSWFVISDQYAAFCPDSFFGFSRRLIDSALICLSNASLDISSIIA